MSLRLAVEPSCNLTSESMTIFPLNVYLWKRPGDKTRVWGAVLLPSRIYVLANRYFDVLSLSFFPLALSICHSEVHFRLQSIVPHSNYITGLKNNNMKL